MARPKGQVEEAIAFYATGESSRADARQDTEHTLALAPPCTAADRMREFLGKLRGGK